MGNTTGSNCWDCLSTTPGTGPCWAGCKEILPTPGHDVYVVVQGQREFLLPAVAEVVVEINLQEGFLKVAPPPGLLETYAH